MFEQIYTEKPFDFTKHSTIGCGGFAKVAYYPKDETETLFLLSACKDGWVALGNLSNVLPSDEGLNKAVICTKRLTEIRAVADGVFVSSGSACSAHSHTTSSALLAFGLCAEDADCSLRISLSEYNSKEDIDALCASLESAMARLVRIKR